MTWDHEELMGMIAEIEEEEAEILEQAGVQYIVYLNDLGIVSEAIHNL